MSKSITLFISLANFFFMNAAIAQDQLKDGEIVATKRDTRTLNILSIYGKKNKVKITPDYVNHELRIVCLNDSITISDFWGVPPEIHLLNKNFIEIKYAIRGGSSLGLGNLLILCVNNNKLCEAMHSLSYNNGESGGLKTDYHIQVSINGNSKSNYKLTVKIHDDSYSKPDPETNYTYNNTTVLSFDTNRHAFYSIKEDLFDKTIMTKTGIKTKKKIDTNCPVILLGKETYYLINNRWYQLESGNIMNEIFY